jgi:hypothetical protein
VTVSGERRVRSSRWLRVHRSQNAVEVMRARGLPVTSVARTLVDTWGDAHRARAMRGYDGVAREAVLRATRGRRVTAAELLAQFDIRPELPSSRAPGSPEARERDLRRDAALAALGWVVLRFSYRRLRRRDRPVPPRE